MSAPNPKSMTGDRGGGPHEVPATPRAGKAGAGLEQAGRWSTVGAAGSAVLASACCWLPLLLLALGLSAGGVAGVFEALRPYLLLIAALLLSLGFYLAYFHKPACEPGDACATPSAKVRRLNRGMLWVATVLVVAFALFPYYSGAIVPAAGGSASGGDGGTAATAELENATFRVEGMTCAGCAAAVHQALLGVKGVEDVRVNYDPPEARVRYAPTVSEAQLKRAVARAGFGLETVDGDGRGESRSAFAPPSR